MKNIDQLKKYAELIHQKNQVMNITGFKSQEEIFSEGIMNSLEAFKPFEDKFTDQNIKLLDIGAGAGFPSLPFLIANPEKIDLTILESQKKRCDFLEDVAKALNLRLNVINNRAEEEKSYNNFFDVVTARAVSSVKNMYLMAHLFNIPIDDLRGAYTLAKAIRESKYSFTVVSPDHGGTVRARRLAELIADTVKISIIDKRRIGTNQTEVMGLIGDVQDQNAVIIDDIIDTGGTILKAVHTLKENGAKKIVIAATHGLFTKGFEVFENDPDVEKVIITDSIDNSEIEDKFTKLQIVSLDTFLSGVIECHINGQSISDLYTSFAENISK